MAYLIAPAETDGNKAGAVLAPRGIVISPESRGDYALGSVVGSGLSSISGTITVDGVPPTDAYAALCQESDGVPVGWTAVALDGTYSFSLVGPGNYIAVIVDGNGVKRAKAVHTIVP